MDYLVQQKNEIIDLINNGNIIEAMVVLKILRPLWESESYGYKYRELMERADLAASYREDANMAVALQRN